MKNNFNFLRLLFAVFVVITHSYPLSGSLEKDWLEQISHKQAWFSYIGVNGLFIISGYLIFQSLCRSKSLAEYYSKRILRIFPALLVVLVLTVVSGFFIYPGDLYDYTHSPSVRSYIPNNFFLYNIQYNIEGIFENNPFKSMINGSLWTIAYEFTLYLLLSLIFFFNINTKRIIVASLFFLLLTGKLFFTINTAKYQGILNATYFYDFALNFFSGCFLAGIRFERFNRYNLFIISSFILLILSIYLHIFDSTQFLFLPVLVISAGLAYYKYIHIVVSRIGDLSYGIYIYSFPVMQSIVYFFKLTAIPLMLLSLIISSLFAYFSWHIIEKRAIGLKRKSLGLI